MTESDADAAPQTELESDPLMRTVAEVLRLQAARTLAAPIPAAILALLGSLPEAFRG